MKRHIGLIVSSLFLIFSVATFAGTTPDNYGDVGKIKMSLLDGGMLYTEAIYFTVNNNNYALKLDKDAKLSPLNQRIYDNLIRIISGQVKLSQIHTFDGEVLKAGDISYKLVAAINIEKEN